MHNAVLWYLCKWSIGKLYKVNLKINCINITVAITTGENLLNKERESRYVKKQTLEILNY